MGDFNIALPGIFTSFWRILFLAEPLPVSLPHFSGFENRPGKKSEFTTKMAKWKKEFRRQNSEVRRKKEDRRQNENPSESILTSDF
jgi:hypothetical protein